MIYDVARGDDKYASRQKPRYSHSVESSIPASFVAIMGVYGQVGSSTFSISKRNKHDHTINVFRYRAVVAECATVADGYR